MRERLSKELGRIRAGLRAFRLRANRTYTRPSAFRRTRANAGGHPSSEPAEPARGYRRREPTRDAVSGADTHMPGRAPTRVVQRRSAPGIARRTLATRRWQSEQSSNALPCVQDAIYGALGRILPFDHFRGRVLRKEIVPLVARDEVADSIGNVAAAADVDRKRKRLGPHDVTPERKRLEHHERQPVARRQPNQQGDFLEDRA